MFLTALSCPDAGYATNDPFLNHCLVTFFKRICDPSGINLEPMLYQAGPCMSELRWPALTCMHVYDVLLPVQVSILRIFYEIMSDVSYRKQPGASEVLCFTLGIVRHVFSKLIPTTSSAELEDGTGEGTAGKGDPVRARLQLQGSQLLRECAAENAACFTVLLCVGSGHEKSDGEAAQAELNAERQEHDAQNAAVQKGLSTMMFVELLFWKNARDCEEVRDEYRWKVPACTHSCTCCIACMHPYPSAALQPSPG